MIKTCCTTMSPSLRTVAALRELIRALDRRRPHLDRANEAGIARDARLLRQQAVAQIEELRLAGLLRDRNESELAAAIMTDDGGPITGTTVVDACTERAAVQHRTMA